jgi:8-oxo-dGTP pyrophosphatase MutT (NUDIX family)
LLLPEDHRAPLISLLESYRAAWPEEVGMVDRYLSFVRENPDCFERSLEAGHVTGSAIILDTTGNRVLLTHHRKLDRWLQPGGHADGIADVAQVAMTEALEESGLASLDFASRSLLDVDIHGIPARAKEPAHFHYDCRFLIQSGGSDEFIVSDESHDLAWVPRDRITDYTDEDSILRMLDKIPALLN